MPLRKRATLTKPERVGGVQSVRSADNSSLLTTSYTLQIANNALWRVEWNCSAGFFLQTVTHEDDRSAKLSECCLASSRPPGCALNHTFGA